MIINANRTPVYSENKTQKTQRFAKPSFGNGTQRFSEFMTEFMTAEERGMAHSFETSNGLLHRTHMDLCNAIKDKTGSKTSVAGFLGLMAGSDVHILGFATKVAKRWLGFRDKSASILTPRNLHEHVSPELFLRIEEPKLTHGTPMIKVGEDSIEYGRYVVKGKGPRQTAGFKPDENVKDLIFHELTPVVGKPWYVLSTRAQQEDRLKGFFRSNCTLPSLRERNLRA